MADNKRQIGCEIVADSINEFGDRVTSAIFTLPRLVLAELNTHRMLSKNSASSRAIPFLKMVDMVLEDPFIPIAWQKDHSGMQGTEYFTEEDLYEPIKMSDRRSNVKTLDELRNKWIYARDNAVTAAYDLHDLGLTKQLCNRVLEPYMWHKVLITGTDWDNFFALRAHPDAEIHIAKLADEALKAFNASTPKQLKVGEWHIPFGDTFDDDLIAKLNVNLPPTEIKKRIAVARCARVSYNNFDGSTDYQKDLDLYKRLFATSPIHASPAEHVCRAMREDEYNSYVRATKEFGVQRGYCRNFKGFIQHRVEIPHDTILRDARLLRHG